MSTRGTDWREATFPVMTEAELGRWLAAGGVRIVESRGRLWQRVMPGFYQPLHFLARFTREQLARPRPFAWGYRAVVAEADAPRATGTLPIYIIPDLASYGLDRLDGRRRNAIRRAARQVDLVVLAEPDILLDKGPAIVREATGRNPQNRGVPERHFRAWIEAGFARPGPVFLGMLLQGVLVGFSVGFAVEEVAYYHLHFIADAARSLNLDRFSFHAKATMAQRSPGIRTMANGLDVPESEGLADFKASQGLVVAQYPSRVAMPAPIDRLIRWLRPYSHYRLTGRLPEPDGRPIHHAHHQESVS